MEKKKRRRKITDLPRQVITAIQSASDKKATDITVLDLRNAGGFTDYFIICTSDSDPQTRSIFNHIKDGLIIEKIKPWKTEGYEFLNWVIMDYINFVIHIFNKETRDYYDFERLWADAKITKIKVTI